MILGYIIFEKVFRRFVIPHQGGTFCAFQNIMYVYRTHSAILSGRAATSLENSPGSGKTTNAPPPGVTGLL
jgi:hypothetical protein